MLIFDNGSHTGKARWPECGDTRRPRVNTTMAEPAERIDTEIDEKYGEFETDDGDLIVYDRDDKSAWVQSNTVTPVEQ